MQQVDIPEILVILNTNMAVGIEYDNGTVGAEAVEMGFTESQLLWIE